MSLTAGTRRSERQEALLDALVRLFVEEGFAAFTLDDLARRLHCSKATLYVLAPSKEQLVVRVLRRFFARATAAVEAEIADVEPGPERVAGYLTAVARALGPYSEQVYGDIAAFAPAAEMYRRNTLAAGRRVQDLIDEGVAAGRIRDDIHAAFVGAAVGAVMEAIQSREVSRRTGLGDAAAYAELADLVVSGLRG